MSRNEPALMPAYTVTRRKYCFVFDYVEGLRGLAVRVRRGTPALKCVDLHESEESVGAGVSDLHREGRLQESGDWTGI